MIHFANSTLLYPNETDFNQHPILLKYQNLEYILESPFFNIIPFP